MSRPDRGQVVLLAAAALAIALVPMVLAYLQLGYGADTEAISTDPAPERQAERVLSQAFADASGGIPANYTWSDRDTAAETVRNRIEDATEELAVSDLGHETVYLVEPNGTRATAIAAGSCPGGPNREFGPCEANGGLVLQRRAGETHVLAAAFDVSIVQESTERELTLAVETAAGP